MKKSNVLLASVIASFSLSALAVNDVIYLSDTMGPADGKSALYRVDIDSVSGHANLSLLPDGIVDFNHVDSLAAEQDGSIIWLIDNNSLIKYEVATATVDLIGSLANFSGDSDQAAVSPDGTLYVTNKTTGGLYSINKSTAEATLVGTLTVGNGGDIAFDQYGTLYMVNQNGLFELTLPIPPSETVGVELIGPVSDRYTGLAFRAGGLGNLLGSNGIGNAIRELSVVDASAVANGNYPMYKDDLPFDHLYGDMTTGPLVMCSKTIGYWKNHAWNGATVTINGLLIDEIIGRFGDKEEGDKPYNGSLWSAKGKTYSMLYAQLIAAKLNTNNSYTVQLLNDAEAFLFEKDFNDVVSKADRSEYSAFVQAVTAFNEDNHCDSE
ncbi:MULTISPECIES: hypothetical protein [Shewanella]|uniref:SMP-30/gluconolactonase/LRE family protein n=1 Tax=Shewanella marisflavi TaxID=260364 RepID=A0ABX5WRR2_9GAMM|nr:MULTISPECIES: hypothetical protein [Shewanella]QDF75841.1 hypothetical protein FGA12_12165 [Shewanella marisflavi]